MKFRAFFIVLTIVLAWPLLGYLERWLQGDQQPVSPIASEGVVLFVTPNCSSCERARAFLQAQQVPFSEFDVQASPEAMRHFEAIGGMAAPTILVHNRVIHGFNEKAITNALRAAR